MLKRYPDRMTPRRRLTLEWLEPRLVFSNSPFDQFAIVYDNGVVGDLDSEFTRDVATVDDRGILQGINEQRYGNTVDHAPLLTWDVEATALTTGSARILATGWDHDGTTPLLVLQNQSQSQLLVFRGESLELVGSIRYQNSELDLWGTGNRYRPTAAIVHHGLIVMFTERMEYDGANYVTAGTTFMYTQDYGATIDRVAQVGGGFDVPAISDDASLGMSRGRTWAFLNPFPADGLDDTSKVWFPWADYIQKSNGPKGGQIGVFQAVRNDESGLWSVLPNRLVFEQWVPGDSGGFHAHTAAITTGGMISHWGDVGYRNQAIFHQFDLTEYQTAPITTRVVYGGYSSSPSIEQGAPQPVAAAPSPIAGEHFASGDLTTEVILEFGALSNVDDPLRVSAAVSIPYRATAGSLYSGADILHLQWVSGIGYVSGSGGDQFLHYSPDGFRWVELNMPTGLTGNVWLYGDKLLTIDGNNRPWTTDLPTISSLNPLQIAPGGTNRVAGDLPLQSNLGAGNTRRQVEFVDGVWRYKDDGQPLSHQPDPPPFSNATPVYEVTLGSDSRDLGIWWLQPPGETLSASQPNLLDLWVYNLGDQSVQLGNRLRVPGVGGGAATELTHESNVNFEWVPLGVRQDPPFDGEGRFAVGVTTSRSGSVNAGGHFLIAIPYFGELNTPPYPLAPLATGSNELEIVSGFQLQDSWSAGIVFQWPSNAPQSMTGRMPVGSFRAIDGSYLEFSVEYTGSGTARVIVELVRSGLPPVTVNLTHNVLRGDIIEIIASVSPGQILATARVGAGQPVSGQAAIQVGNLSTFDEFAWASGDGTIVTTINPLMVMVDDEVAMNAPQQVGWLRATLDGRPTFRINPYPGDYNFDGFVDNDDLVVWQANVGSTSNLAADGDLSGVVDQGDFELWQQYLGTGAIPPINLLPGDFDFNGIVDLLDLDVWEATVGSKKYLNADANRDGIVDLLDRDIWEANLGMLFPVPPQPLPGDYNFDGVVNAADYVVWRDTVPSPYKLMADGDGNGMIGDGDRVFWMSQFGNELPPEASGGGAAVSSAEESGDDESETSDSSAAAVIGFIPESRSTKKTGAPSGSGMQSNRARMLLALDAAFATTENRGVSSFARNHRNKPSENEPELSTDLLAPLPTIAVEAL